MLQGSYIHTETASPELEHKARKASDKFSENLQLIANEPSLAFFRIQEHVRKSLPQLTEKKHEVQDLQAQVQGACFDMEYAVNALSGMEQSMKTFHSITELMKNSMFVKQQLQYEQNRSQGENTPSQTEQERSHPSMYRTMLRTQTVDIPGPVGRDAELTQHAHSKQPTGPLPQVRGSPIRARSSSLSSHTARPPSTFR